MRKYKKINLVDFIETPGPETIVYNFCDKNLYFVKRLPPEGRNKREYVQFSVLLIVAALLVLCEDLYTPSKAYINSIHIIVGCALVIYSSFTDNKMYNRQITAAMQNGIKLIYSCEQYSFFMRKEYKKIVFHILSELVFIGFFVYMFVIFWLESSLSAFAFGLSIFWAWLIIHNYFDIPGRVKALQEISLRIKNEKC